MMVQPLAHLLWLVPLALLAAYVGSERFLGTMAQARVRRLLDAALEPRRYTVVHDLTLPGGGGTIHFDHLIVCRAGVYLVDSIYRTGWISGTRVQAAWRQKTWKGSAKFDNPVHDLAVRAEALADLLRVPLSRIHTLVVFCGPRGFADSVPDNVIRAQRLLARIRFDSRPLLAPEEADRVVMELQRCALRPTFLGPAQRWKLLRAALVIFCCAAVYYTYSDQLKMFVKKVQHQADIGMAPEKFHPDGTPKNEIELWEDRLACAYSVDTGRCACHEPGGDLARITPERCQELAQRGSVLQR
jgi:hypothetical protein